MPLPVDAIIPEVLKSLRDTRNLVVEAAPGAGKTTRIPPALLALGGDVLVLEPRRIAARMAARRVAMEMGEEPGATVGYQVRFEEVAGPGTRLRFLTEGVLTRRLLSDPQLRSVSTVVLDEFHERHLDSDLALTLLLRLQKKSRPDLRIVVMSATLDAEPVRAFLGGCPALRSEGALHPLRVEYSPYTATPLEDQVASAVKRSGRNGHVLVFLPGAAEIRRAERAIQDFARSERFQVAPLYGDLTPAEQDAAVEPSTQPKIILSTNIAESSITIQGVRVVIDSGLSRIASDSPWTGLPALNLQRISRASAQQRAGRAARTGPGTVLRLYTEEDFLRRPEHDEPEILRRELSQLCLHLETMGVRHPYELEWLTPPPEGAIGAAEDLLDRLHARGSAARVIAKYPLHPRLARLVQAGDSVAACRAAALLSSGRPQSTDFLRAVEEPLDGRTRQVLEQIQRLARPRNKGVSLPLAVLQAFPDRVGRRRSGGTVLLSNGQSARMEHPPSEFFVAVDAEERSDREAALIRLASAIEPEWLLDLFSERVTEQNIVEWNRTGERADAVSRLLYDELILDENRGAMPDSARASGLLAVKVMEAGLERFVPVGELDRLRARVEFAAAHSPIRALDDEALQGAVAQLCQGLRSFAEVKASAGRFPELLLAAVDRRVLDEIAPERIKLPSGRWTPVHYETGKTPWVASRLQDFFGLRETPLIARGQVALVVHLLAPNQRAVQTTTDLAGFWVRLYPQLRKELGRRYPRHAWPENV